jgi:hypothetical protein
MADSSSSTLDEEGGNRNDDTGAAAAANALSSPPSSSQSPMPVAPPPVNTRDGNNNNNSNNNNEERVGNGVNTIDSSAAAKNFTINMENLRYAMESFVAIVKPGEFTPSLKRTRQNRAALLLHTTIVSLTH